MSSPLQQVLLPLNKDVYAKLKVFFDYARELILYSDEVVGRLQKEKISASSIDPFKKLVLFSFFKSTSFGISTWLIASNGQPNEASTLVRTLIEITIKLLFVVKDSGENRLNLAADYWKYENFSALLEVEEAIRICKKLGYTTVLEDFLSKAREIKDNIGSTERDKLWPSKSLERIATEADCHKYYRLIFSPHSRKAHFSPQDVKDFFDENNRRWTLGYTYVKVEQILIQLCEMQLHILNVLSETFFAPRSLGKLNNFIEKLNELVDISEQALDETMKD